MANAQRSGQAAIEFLILAGVMLLALLGLVLLLSQRSAILRERAQLSGLIQAGEILQGEAVNAARVEDGYERAFELPATADGEPYTATIYENTEVALRTQISEYVLFLPVNVTLDHEGLLLRSGTIRPGKHTVRRTGGQVIIT